MMDFALGALSPLAGLAWWLRLGGSPTLASDDDVCRAASEAVDGFDPVAIALASITAVLGIALFCQGAWVYSRAKHVVQNAPDVVA